VNFTAYDFSIYGGLPAKLERISADTITNDKDESFYLIYLRTNDNQIESSKGSLEIIPGMTTTVDILTGKKTVMDYLLKPILKAKNEALRER
jgi:adhesin transport system membrane fusion protein